MIRLENGTVYIYHNGLSFVTPVNNISKCIKTIKPPLNAYDMKILLKLEIINNELTTLNSKRTKLNSNDKKILSKFKH